MARLVIGACNEGKEIYFEDKEIQEIISLYEWDKYAIEKEMEKRAMEKRPYIRIHIHIFTLEPFFAIACVGNPAEDWWTDYGVY